MTFLQIKALMSIAVTYIRLSGALGKYITTGLDEAEVTVTRAESSIGGDDGEYLDLQSAKKALDAFQVS